MAAGIAALELLESESPYARLEILGGRIQAALTEAAKSKGLPLQVPQVGSMFALFFSDSPVRNYDDATGSATDHFKSVFQYCLENGVYLPPSPFETCFISTAHEGEAIDRACQVIADAIKNI
jgi:glutamate-1-semialdehyde 2,1-aminomutase